MEYYITIDHGNTAVKAALYDDSGTLLDVVKGKRIDDSLIESLTRGRHITAAIYCSVARRDDSETECLNRHCDKVLTLTAQLPLPITIDYSHTETLGVDRIAATVGARMLLPDCDLLVVDSGTAVTYDVMSADGRFVGGNIAPGVKMSLDALHHYTAALPAFDAPRSIDTSTPFGVDTESAMIKGVVYGIAGAIEGYLRHLPPGTRLVITGGHAPLLAEALTVDAIVATDLVTDGLYAILRYNIDGDNAN